MRLGGIGGGSDGNGMGDVQHGVVVFGSCAWFFDEDRMIC